MEIVDFARLTVRFEKPEYETIERLAKERDVSNAEVVRRAVAAYLQADAENSRLRDLLQTEIGGINRKLEEHTAMLYASISGSAMLSAMILERDTGESEAAFTSRKHSRVDRTIVDAMELGKWLVNGYQKIKNESPAKR